MWPVSAAHQTAESVSVFTPSLGAHGFPSNPEETTIAPVMIDKEIKRERKRSRNQAVCNGFQWSVFQMRFLHLSSMVAEGSLAGLAAVSMVGLIPPCSVLILRIWGAVCFKSSQFCGNESNLETQPFTEEAPS